MPSRDNIPRGVNATAFGELFSAIVSAARLSS